MRKIIPVENKVVVHIRKPVDRTVGGIILTEASQHSTEGIVVASGVKGIESGDVVLFIPEGGFRIAVDGKEFLVLHDKEVLAILVED